METEVLTFQDAVDHVLEAFECDNAGLLKRQARRAVRIAYRKLADLHRWSYYHRRRQIVTVPSQGDGTAAYDHEGGASPRLVTLSGATVPEDVRFYQLILGQNIYAIESYESSTTFTLTQDSNPGEDVDATTYTLFRGHYPLPVDFRRAMPLVEIANSFFPDYVTPEELLTSLVGNYQPGRPRSYTIRNAGEFYGGMCIEFAPPPSDARTYDFICEVTGRPLRTLKDTGGTATVNGGSRTFTLSGGGSLKAAHEGCIIRFSSTATEPTGLDGNEELDNPYFAQRVIESVDSASTGTLDAVVSDDGLANVGYTISDPIDVESQSMLNLFWSLCEAAFVRLRKYDPKDRMEREMSAQRELISAMGADNRMKDLGQMTGPAYITKLSDMAIIE